MTIVFEEIRDNVVVVLTDQGYFPRAINTIRDIRDRGQWKGDLVIISVGFDLPHDFVSLYDIQEKKFSRIDLTEMYEKIGEHGFDNTDHRELNKQTQWEKIHLFDPWFSKWEKVIYFDAGFRIVDKIEYLLPLPTGGGIIAPNDAGFPCGDRGAKTDSRFRRLVYPKANESILATMRGEYGENFMDAEYFCNCIWVYDTVILDRPIKEEMIATAIKYPIWVSNEMGVMNAVLNVKYGLWTEMPSRNQNGKYLYAWSEPTLRERHTTWRDYCYIKYAATI
jgi:hypothetical protein